MKRFSFLVLLLASRAAMARPLFLEPAATEGKLSFESIVSLTGRVDKYGTPTTKYQSESFPVTFRVGVHRRLDLGFTVQHVSHRVEVDGLRFSGSDSGRFSPEVKWGLRDNLSIMGMWHKHTIEQAHEGIPIARGNSPEVRLLGAIPIPWPICVDVGYLWQGRYNGRLGIDSAEEKDIDPGNVADARLALLIPLPANFSASLESIYSHISDEKVNGVTINDTAGNAWDVFGGLTWMYRDVTIGAGVGTSLLDESHTSFAIDRGAGDLTAKFLFSYKLHPHRAAGQ